MVLNEKKYFCIFERSLPQVSIISRNEIAQNTIIVFRKPKQNIKTFKKIYNKKTPQINFE